MVAMQAAATAQSEDVCKVYVYNQHGRAPQEEAAAHPAMAGAKHMSGVDLDLILGAPGQASKGVAALLQGLELPL